jgi:hypothetical protein
MRPYVFLLWGCLYANRNVGSGSVQWDAARYDLPMQAACAGIWEGRQDRGSHTRPLGVCQEQHRCLLCPVSEHNGL